MRKIFLILVPFILLNDFSFTQQGKGIITGVVKDLKTNKPINEVMVRISQTKQSTFTNEKGEFKFENLNPGPYTLRFFHKEYSTLKIPHQEVFANSTIFIPVTLVTGSGEGEGTDEAFFIGGIEVIAKKSVLPEKSVTTTEISAGEIEHLQASSLGDVMQLIPGVGQMNQGLSQSSQLSLRGVHSLTYFNESTQRYTSYVGDATSQGTMFGTKIVVDGSTISNNANLNTIVLPSGVSTNAASGVDLRGIPADNIESIEVLRGVASAKYGDFTEGVVLVKTKGGYQPQRLKIKSNPDTKELNFNGGIKIFEDMSLNYNFNLGNSERNIRREGDEYQRLAGQIKLTNTFFEDKSLNIINGLYYTRLFDDYKDMLNPETGKQYYNHTFSLLYNNDINYKIDNFSQLEFHTTINYTKQDKFDQDIPKGTEADNRYITGFMNPGTYPVQINIGSYIYQVTEKGNMWTINLEGEWSRRGIKTGTLINNLSAGLQYQYDDNTGEGMNFDPQRPPHRDQRPFSYDAVPANSILSLFTEDEIHGLFWKPFTLNIGLRYEMFSPQSINFKGLLFKTDFIKSRSGSFLEPRISLRYILSSDTRIRLAYGKNAKSPSLSYLYPQPQYMDVRDYYGDSRDTIQNMPRLFTTYKFDRQNLNIRGYEESKYELSIDQKITEDVGITLRGYYSYRDKEATSYTRYQFIPTLTHPNLPNPGNETILNYLVADYREYKNKRYSKFHGVDLILTTKKIESLNSSFYIAGTFGYSEGGKDGGDIIYGSPAKFSSLDSLKKLYHTGDNIIPIYLPGDQLDDWSQKLMMTYKWDFTIRKLGLWFTLWAQQIVHLKYKYFSQYNKEAIGYYTDLEGGKIIYYSADVPSDAKLKTYILEEFSQPVIDTWTFNINISKSLYKGAEISFFVNSFLDRRNNIFYGLEFSIDANKIFE